MTEQPKPAHRGGPLTGEAAELFAALRLRACRAYPYFAAALFALIPRAAPGYGTFGVDLGWRIHVDPEVLEQWSVDEATAVLVHEVQHLVRDHHRRAGQLDHLQHRLWNLAADAAINDDLVSEGLPLPDPVLPEHLGQESGGFEEAYYAAIAAADTIVVEAMTGGQESCGSGAGGLPSEAELAAAEDDPIGGESDSWISEIEAELVRRTVAREVVEAKDRGDHVPNSLVLWARDLTQPKIPWQRVLQASLRHSIRSATGAAQPTYQRADRRADSRPDFIYPGEVRYRASVAVVIDTSGSMGQRHLDAATTEISGICARSGTTTTAVLSCDASAHSVQHVRDAASVELTGGGGTDMRVGIRAAAELTPRPDIIVVLTDGLTPWPRSAPRGTRLVAVLIGDHGDAPRGPGITSCRIPANAR